jgi:hypothetical protein
MIENMKMKFNASAQSRSPTGAENGLQIFSASLCVLRSAISQLRRVPRRFSRSADSLVREFHATPKQHADKAVRAPLVAAPPRHASALI